MQALQARIRPHFLFNSINAVLSLIRSQPKQAETALEDMADLFRVLMADNRELVPLAQEELTLKIQALFKHQSQKDSAPFPGQDDREFWQRVEARNKGTAELLNQLGLAEYFAMEAYVVNPEPR